MNWPLYLKLLLLCMCIIVFCEFGVYYLVLLRCRWPQLPSMRAAKGTELHVMIIADTHLLGPNRGHWFDKLRREWQMNRAFQTAMTLHSPEAVFVLGDLFDEGLWTDGSEFEDYVQHFKRLFAVPEHTQLNVVVGNHDIGFHDGITPYLNQRFVQAFNAPAVRVLTLKGNHFVLLNSMAMEGDGCYLCRTAEEKIRQISEALECTKTRTSVCQNNFGISNYSRPILLQHFPMHRDSDQSCHEPDEAPADEKNQAFREKWECISKESSQMLINLLNPRVIVTGHTHHGCRLEHPNGAEEWTLPSFNWHNKNNPSLALAVFTPTMYSIGKCYMPRESTVIKIYLCSIIAIIAVIIFFHRNASAKLASVFHHISIGKII